MKTSQLFFFIIWSVFSLAMFLGEGPGGFANASVLSVIFAAVLYLRVHFKLEEMVQLQVERSQPESSKIYYVFGEFFESFEDHSSNKSRTEIYNSKSFKMNLLCFVVLVAFYAVVCLKKQYVSFNLKTLFYFAVMFETVVISRAAHWLLPLLASGVFVMINLIIRNDLMLLPAFGLVFFIGLYCYHQYCKSPTADAFVNNTLSLAVLKSLECLFIISVTYFVADHFLPNKLKLDKPLDVQTQKRKVKDYSDYMGEVKEKVVKKVYEKILERKIQTFRRQNGERSSTSPHRRPSEINNSVDSTTSYGDGIVDHKHEHQNNDNHEQDREKGRVYNVKGPLGTKAEGGNVGSNSANGQEKKALEKISERDMKNWAKSLKIGRSNLERLRGHLDKRQGEHVKARVSKSDYSHLKDLEKKWPSKFNEEMQRLAVRKNTESAEVKKEYKLKKNSEKWQRYIAKKMVGQKGLSESSKKVSKNIDKILKFPLHAKNAKLVGKDMSNNTDQSLGSIQGGTENKDGQFDDARLETNYQSSSEQGSQGVDGQNTQNIVMNKNLDKISKEIKVVEEEARSDLEFWTQVVTKASKGFLFTCVFFLLIKLFKKTDATKIRSLQVAPEVKKRIYEKYKLVLKKELPPRDKVIKCYHLILELMAESKFGRDEYVSPSDYSNIVGKRFPLIKKPMATITDTFCECLYGRHEIAEKTLKNYLKANDNFFSFIRS